MGESLVYRRGHGIADFQPGRPLEEFEVNYLVAGASGGEMKVVGHVDQMHHSRCYRETESLTCTTCHDPHAPARDRAGYAAVCRECHADESCRLSGSERQRAGNDCLTCHMPQVPTEITHIAFTHHRIGIHRPDDARTATAMMHAGSAESESAPVELVPFGDLADLRPAEVQRNLALAYFAFAQKSHSPALTLRYQERAGQMLLELRQLGWRGPETTAALARLAYQRQQPEPALQLAAEALQYDNLLPKSRINLLYYLGDINLRMGRLPAAEQALQRLTRMRRLSEDWLLLAICRERSGDLTEALADLEKAATIAPFRAELHDDLAQVHARAGHDAAAARERSVAERLRHQAPQPKP